jgi:hypothetical protein
MTKGHLINKSQPSDPQRPALQVSNGDPFDKTYLNPALSQQTIKTKVLADSDCDRSLTLTPIYVSRPFHKGNQYMFIQNGQVSESFT